MRQTIFPRQALAPQPDAVSLIVREIVAATVVPHVVTGVVRGALTVHAHLQGAVRSSLHRIPRLIPAVTPVKNATRDQVAIREPGATVIADTRISWIRQLRIVGMAGVNRQTMTFQPVQGIRTQGFDGVPAAQTMAKAAETVTTWIPAAERLVTIRTQDATQTLVRVAELMTGEQVQTWISRTEHSVDVGRINHQ